MAVVPNRLTEYRGVNHQGGCSMLTLVRRSVTLHAGFAVALMLLAPALVRAAVIHVPADQPTITSAIAAAGSGDTIAVAAGTYNEASLTVAKTLVIQGAGAGVTIIQAGATEGVSTVRVFTLNAGYTVTLRGMTIRHGRVVGDAMTPAIGGGILSDATLTLDGVEVTHNQATCISGTTNCQITTGAGVAIRAGTLTMTNSQVTNNSVVAATCTPACGSASVRAGGLYLGGASTITASTIASNSIAYPSGTMSTAYGAGIYHAAGTLRLLNSTISGNSGAFNGSGLGVYGGTAVVDSTTITANVNNNGVDGAGMYLQGTNARLRNTIIAGNVAQVGGMSGQYPDIANAATMGFAYASSGYNYLGDTPQMICTTGFGYDTVACVTTGNQITLNDAKLGALGANGGPTPTHALLAGSPAIGAGACTKIDGSALTVDQRAFARQATTCSIGAYEAAPYGTALVTSTPEPAGPNCAQGGVMVQTGFDYNGTGAFEPGEDPTVTYVCNGADGAPGPTGSDGAPGHNSLVLVTDEPTGANCAAGGQKIQTGLDLNDDGTLQADEVTETFYVCDGAAGADGTDGASGASGHDSLVLVSDEPAGANCAAGGKKIQTGLDANGNGTLDAGEVAATSYVCNGATGANGAAGADGKSGGCAAAGGAAGLAALWPLALLVARRRRRAA
jgi:hypothetical protein